MGNIECGSAALAVASAPYLHLVNIVSTNISQRFG